MGLMNSIQRKPKSESVFIFKKQTYTQGKGKIGFNTKAYHKLHSKAMVTFKGGWGKLYYIEHTLLSNVGQLPFFFFFFFFEKQHIHTRERERSSNTKAHHNSTQKSW